MENSSSEPLLGISSPKHDSYQKPTQGPHGWGLSGRVCGTGCGFSDEKSRAADSHARSAAAKKLSIAIVLCLIFIAVEVAGGLISNSLAILTDAAHLLSDVAGFAISLFAIWASSWEATPRQSYGYFRLEILGALLSIQLIWLLTGIIVYEAIYRMTHTSERIDGRLMFIVASFGFCVNIIMVFLLGHHGHSHGHDHHGHIHGHDDSHNHKGHGHDHHGHSHGHGHDRSGDGHSYGHSSHGQRHSHKHAHGLTDEHQEGHQVSKDSNSIKLGRKDNQHEPEHHAHDHTQDHENDEARDHSHGHDDEHHHIHYELTHSQVRNFQSEHEIQFPELGRKDSFKVDIEIEPEETSAAKKADAGNINVRGAWLHVFGDLIQSIGVMVGGAIIWAMPEWRVVDFICTLLFSVLVLGTTVKILRDIVEILMESTPREIDVKRLEKGLCDIPGVIAIHELHIWAITMGKTLLACHVTIYSDADADAILQQVLGYCERVFNIGHVTVQIERERGTTPPLISTH